MINTLEYLNFQVKKGRLVTILEHGTAKNIQTAQQFMVSLSSLLQGDSDELFLDTKVSEFFQITKSTNLYMFFYQLYKSFFKHNFIFF